MDSSEYIDDYFKDLLTGEQKLHFEQRITSDTSFAEEVAFYISANSLFKGQLEEEKKSRFRELYEQAKEGKGIVRPVRRWWPYIAAAAAVLIVLAGLWWIFIRQAGPEQLADEYIRQNLLTQGVSMSSKPDKMQNALNTYNSGNLPEALRQFEQILRKDESNYKAKEYAGLVCLRLKEYDPALQYFQQLATYTGLYANRALLYQSLTLMKRNRPGDAQKAKQLLQQVVDQDLDGKETALQWLKKL